MARMRFAALSTLAVVLATAAAATAQSASVAAPPPAPPGVALKPLPSDYVIGPQDVLLVHVWKNDSLSRQLPVRPDGKISLPLLHDIHAAGLTPMQLRDKIAAALAEFMPNPEVSVAVVEVHSYRVSVLGEVQRPGMLELKAPTTVLEALAMAGGFQPFASPSKIVIFRKDGRGDTQKLRFNYNRAIGGDGGEDNVTLRAGDVIVVP